LPVYTTVTRHPVFRFSIKSGVCQKKAMTATMQRIEWFQKTIVITAFIATYNRHIDRTHSDSRKFLQTGDFRI
jgi:hypothetical protein